MNYRPFLILAGLGLLLIILDQFHLTRPLYTAGSWLTQPALAAETKATRKSISLFTIVTSLRDLARENAQLHGRINELEAEVAQLKEVKHENEILRQELKFTQETEDGYVPAQLIGRTPIGTVKDLIINRGSRDGLVAGQAVLAQGYLIGVTAEVQERQSTVSLISNPSSLVPIMLQESRSTGLLRGGISGLTITDILIDATINADETIVTSGLGGKLPVGIPVGKVLAVTAQKGDITKKATVTTPVDTTKLEVVFIRKVGR